MYGRFSFGKFVFLILCIFMFRIVHTTRYDIIKFVLELAIYFCFEYLISSAGQCVHLLSSIGQLCWSFFFSLFCSEFLVSSAGLCLCVKFESYDVPCYVTAMG